MHIMIPKRTTTAGLRSLLFLRLWTGSTASSLATWGFPFVLGLAVLDGMVSPTMLGSALAARTLAFLVALPISGVLADRSDARRVIAVASALATIGAILVALGLVQPQAEIKAAAVLIGALLAGAGQGACRPAYQAMVPAIVAVDDLQGANAAMSISVRVTGLLGPTLATAVAVTWSARAALVMIALLWVLSALAPPRAPSAATSGPTHAAPLSLFGRQWLEGLAEARRHRWFLAGLGALTAVIAAGYSVTAVLLPIIGAQSSHGPALLVWCMTAYACGALLAALVISRWRPQNRGWIALAGLALYGLVPFSLTMPSSLLVPTSAFFLAGVGIEIFNVLWFSAIQREIPPDRIARVSSIDFLMSYGLAPLGLVAMVPLVEAFGIMPVLLGAGALCMAAPLAAAAVASSRAFSEKPHVGMER